LPTFFLIITVVAMFQHGSVWLVMILIGLTSWPSLARLTRGELLRVRQMEFVSAAQALGFQNRRIIFRHVLPNSLAPVLISTAFGIASAILTEAGLSFLGFGVPPTEVTWGSVLSDARNDIHAWWLAVFPGFAIFLAVVSYNLVGDGLRDALDPRLRD
jgi:peptide/nickel transport system permease protein